MQKFLTILGFSKARLQLLSPQSWGGFSPIVSVLAAIVVVGMSLWFAIDTRSTALTAAGVAERNLAKAVAQNADRAIEGTSIVLRTTADLLEQNELGSYTPNELHALLQERSNGLLQVKSLIVADRTGKIVAESLAYGFDSINISKHEEFTIHSSSSAPRYETVVGSPTRSLIDGQPTFCVSLRINNHNGDFAGVVIAEMDLSYFRLFYQSIDIISGGRITLLNKDGLILVSQPYIESEIGQPYRDDPDLAANLQNSTTKNLYIGASTIDKQLVAYHGAEDGRFIALISFPLISLLSDWRQGFVRTMSIAGAVVFALSILGVLLWQQNKRSELATQALQKSLKTLSETQSQLVQAEKMASLGTLVAGVAHEINTPLGIAVTATSQLIHDAEDIKGAIASGQLSRGKLDGFVKGVDQGLNITYSNLTRAANLVSSFKQVAVDQNSEQAREIDLADYINDILRSLDPILKSAKVQVEQLVPAGIKLKTQPGALAQVVTNLVQNAVKHAFDGVSQPKLSFSSNAVSTAEIQLILTDNGVGMDEATRARAFDPFFTTKRGAGGTGLGLHIVHNLMSEGLKGRIEFTSRPGNGTEFRMTFPV